VAERCARGCRGCPRARRRGARQRVGARGPAPRAVADIPDGAPHVPLQVALRLQERSRRTRGGDAYVRPAASEAVLGSAHEMALGRVAPRAASRARRKRRSPRRSCREPPSADIGRGPAAFLVEPLAPRGEPGSGAPLVAGALTAFVPFVVGCALGPRATAPISRRRDVRHGGGFARPLGVARLQRRWRRRAIFGAVSARPRRPPLIAMEAKDPFYAPYLNASASPSACS